MLASRLASSISTLTPGESSSTSIAARPSRSACAIAASSGTTTISHVADGLADDGEILVVAHAVGDDDHPPAALVGHVHRAARDVQRLRGRLGDDEHDVRMALLQAHDRSDPASRSPMMILPSDSSSVSRPSGETPQHVQPGFARSIREATTSRTPSGASRPKRWTKPSVVARARSRRSPVPDAPRRGGPSPRGRRQARRRASGSCRHRAQARRVPRARAHARSCPRRWSCRPHLFLRQRSS